MMDAEAAEEPTIIRRQRPPKVRPARRAVKGVSFALAYASALVLFAYCSFPYGRLKQKLVTELNAQQTAKNSTRIEIDQVTWSWRFPGLVLEGIRFVEPPKSETQTAGVVAAADEKPADGEEPAEGAAETPEDTSKHERAADAPLEIAELHARVAPLSLLFGTKDVTFGADAFGGELAGRVALSDGESRVELNLDSMRAGELPFLAQIVGLPLEGVVSGKVELRLPEGKFGKAEGEIDLTIDDVAIGDGKAKILGALALPRLQAGTLVVKASIVEGRLKLEEFAAKGPDLELTAEGKLRLRDDVMRSVSDVTLSFRFADRYKTKNDVTKALFGEPSSNTPGLFDLNPQAKRARDREGFYNWRVSGPLASLKFVPASGKASGKEDASPAKTIPARTQPIKPPIGARPLGVPRPAAPPPPPPRPTIGAATGPPGGVQNSALIRRPIVPPSEPEEVAEQPAEPEEEEAVEEETEEVADGEEGEATEEEAAEGEAEEDVAEGDDQGPQGEGVPPPEGEEGEGQPEGPPEE